MKYWCAAVVVQLMVKRNQSNYHARYLLIIKTLNPFSFNVWRILKSSEEPEECVGAYLCLCGPLLPLLFLTAVVSAIWNELSVYELPRA